jgi:hypothetical protein
MPGAVRSIILESIPGGAEAETGNVSTAHHQNRSPAADLAREPAQEATAGRHNLLMVREAWILADGPLRQI